MTTRQPGAASSAPVTLTPSAPPVANAGPNQTVECEGSGGTSVAMDGSGSRDPMAMR